MTRSATLIASAMVCVSLCFAADLAAGATTVPPSPKTPADASPPPAPATTTTVATAPTAPTAPAPPIADTAPALAAAALAALPGSDSAAYDNALTGLATSLSSRVGVSPAALLAAWKAGSDDGMTAMLAALTQLGVGYAFDAATPNVAFDCSGLASWAWAQAGVNLPHQSLLIIDQTMPRTLANVQPGDLLYYPGHVMIALGVGDSIVHAANSLVGVVAASLNGREAADLQVGVPTATTWAGALHRESRVTRHRPNTARLLATS